MGDLSFYSEIHLQHTSSFCKMFSVLIRRLNVSSQAITVKRIKMNGLVILVSLCLGVTILSNTVFCCGGGSGGSGSSQVCNNNSSNSNDNHNDSNNNSRT